MKIFLLAITILFLICRIKSTPRMLSKKLYYANLSRAFEKQKKSLEEESEEYAKLIPSVSVVIVLLFQVLMITYYLLIGNRLSSSTIMLILTALQIVTVFITCRKDLNKKAFSLNIDDHKFHRFYFLFNVILDYIYYPMAIYLLVI